MARRPSAGLSPYLATRLPHSALPWGSRSGFVDILELFVVNYLCRYFAHYPHSTCVKNLPAIGKLVKYLFFIMYLIKMLVD